MMVPATVANPLVIIACNSDSVSSIQKGFRATLDSTFIIQETYIKHGNIETGDDNIKRYDGRKGM